MHEKRVPGPIQVFVIGFDKLEATERILAELRQVCRRRVIRLVDLLVVQKDKQGNLTSSMQLTDSASGSRCAASRRWPAWSANRGLKGDGADLGALAVAAYDYGLGAEELSNLTVVIPPGSAAVLLVIEHWAVFT